MWQKILPIQKEWSDKCGVSYAAIFEDEKC
jgi:hypothetical protein